MLVTLNPDGSIPFAMAVRFHIYGLRFLADSLRCYWDRTLSSSTWDPSMTWDVQVSVISQAGETDACFTEKRGKYSPMVT